MQERASERERERESERERARARARASASASAREKRQEREREREQEGGRERDCVLNHFTPSVEHFLPLPSTCCPPTFPSSYSPPAFPFFLLTCNEEGATRKSSKEAIDLENEEIAF